MVRSDGRQAAFAGVLAARLRAARRSRGLTQAELADRTNGLISKAALANYETGHRSLRVDVFWVLTKALGEDAGAMLAEAERASGYGLDDAAAPLALDVRALRESTDARLEPVRRWFALRSDAGRQTSSRRTVTLDRDALTALAALTGVSPAECRRMLAAAASPRPGDVVAASPGPDNAGPQPESVAAPHPENAGPRPESAAALG